ncbi:MAG: biotin--[acetyl-CoA-carboxylase] ligase [Chloroflexi bacterium]|nr:biotin--[acetyl-CoA-carboxylase] ligase [Chloroflexota bacterium]
MSTDVLSEHILKEILGNRPFQYYLQVGSTNDLARRWALDGAMPGSVVIADEQLEGRGRLGRHWQTPSRQAVAMSIILRPVIGSGHLQRVAALGSVAVAEALTLFVPREIISLKWPNDVLMDGRKVSGILTEALWDGMQLTGIILGIGINVRVDFSATPLADVATSIEDHAPAMVQRHLLVRHVLERVDIWQARINQPLLLATWREWLSTLGHSVTITTQHGVVSGTAQDVDEDGALLVSSPDGRIHRVLVGDVSL